VTDLPAPGPFSHFSSSYPKNGLGVRLGNTAAPGDLGASLALKNATSSIPIVMVAIGDPIATGLVQSLAHRGGNVLLNNLSYRAL
jgi:hypothetical protein